MPAESRYNSAIPSEQERVDQFGQVIAVAALQDNCDRNFDVA
jgi:hypothetical protein